MKRRDILAGAAAGLGASLLSMTGESLAAPLVDGLERNAAGRRPDMTITDIEQFEVYVKDPDEEVNRGEERRFYVYKVTSDAGISGYAFGRFHPYSDIPRVKEILLGQDPFALEDFISDGLCHVSSWENAIWDLIGKACNQPVFRLLGGPYRDLIKLYLTTVWPGNPDQSDISFEQQAEDLYYFKQNGFHAAKIRCWRENPMDDVEALKHIKRAVGDDFLVMFDRTGQRAPWIWSYDQALQVSLAMQEEGAYWIEEPFERENYTSAFRELIPTHESPSYHSIARSARLREAVDIRITGGEGDNDTHMFGQYLINGAFDMLQPDCLLVGGILTSVKIAMMCEAFDTEFILHGIHGLPVAGNLQVDAASPLPYMQELVMTTPGVLPQETLAPGKRLLHNQNALHIDDGYMHIPQGPGLGLDINLDALEHYRVRRR